MIKYALAAVAVLSVACSGNSEETPNNVAPNNGTSNNAATPSVFYYEDAKPIIDAKCVACHTDGAIGPFPLTTFEEVVAVKDLLQTAVSAKSMPPFIYSSVCREYTHDPSLSNDELNTLVDWVDQGAEAGDPAAEGAPLVIELPEPPTFDTTLELPTPYTPRVSPDDYRCFVVDWPFDEPRYITGFGVEPGDDAIVHHVVNFLATPDGVAEAEARDAAEEGPGYTCFGTAGIDNAEQSWVGSWAPGAAPSKLPAGTGIRIEPGSKMIIQLHYNTLTTDPRADLTKVHYETAASVETEGYYMPWANPGWLSGETMRIAAGDSDASHSFAFDPTGFINNGQPIKIWAAGLHMHLLGTSATARIQRADGTEECLADTPRWDFSWQGGVGFKEPAILNPGDRLGLECHWDNSMANQPIIDGQRITPSDVFWGEGTLEEMCLGVFYVTL
jgi:hypothetical protein